MISVVMGINRFDQYVEPAIQSILRQSFPDFELIIVANGADSDSIVDALSGIFPEEKRIRYIKSRIGQLAYALNLGIDSASYNYIARMDADDVAHKDRLGRQYSYLIENDLDLVGCNIQLIDESGIVVGERRFPKGKKIDSTTVYKVGFCHPTVLYKKDLIIKARGYNTGFNSEDYDLWLRLKRLEVKWDNMTDMLLNYRVHANASQRHLLGYAEACGLVMREFVLKKNFVNFTAVVYCFLKSIVRPTKQ